MGDHVELPQSVALIYRIVGSTHVFSSQGIRGLVHVGSHDREKAFYDVMKALNGHVETAYGCEATYKCTISYDDFCSHVDVENDISGNILEVRLDKAA